MPVRRNLEYTLEPGRPWERLLVIKDRRSHRLRHATTSSSVMRLRGGTDSFTLDTSISYEGGVTLFISYEDSLDLTPGIWDFDVVGNFRGHNEKLAEGTIEVLTETYITPLAGGYNMFITHYEGTDFRQRYTWNDADGGMLVVANARLMAVDAQAATVLDLKFFAEGSAPDEAAIGILPDIERGYLSPQTGISLELHISELNGIAPGDYTFDLKVQEEATGDWSVLSFGTIRVEGTITDQLAV
jgi:hypothetical protein